MQSSAQNNQPEPKGNHTTRPDISGKMQRVSLQGLAVVFICDSSEGARTPEIHRHGEKQDQKRSQARLDVYVMKKQSLDSFIDDDHAGEQQQPRLDER